MIELNDILQKVDLEPAKVMVMRHRPTEAMLRKILPWFAAEKHDLYNAYQRSHGDRVEKSLGRATHLASFIGHEPGRALFVGIYRVSGWKEITHDEFWAMECNRELGRLGTRGPAADRRSRWFDLDCTDHLADWKGRLIVSWPGIERAWWRWAHKNVFTVHALREENALVSAMPAWNELVIDWEQLESLPRSWRAAISQWRGIYLILDRASGKSYVGSAYGDQNILGRWQVYASTGHGGNKELKGLDPVHFQFAVLERVSPDMASEEVIQLEATWKTRLGTREFGLNQN